LNFVFKFVKYKKASKLWRKSS